MFSVALGAMFEVLSPTAFFLEIGCRPFEIQALGGRRSLQRGGGCGAGCGTPVDPSSSPRQGGEGSAGRHSMPLVHQVIDCGDDRTYDYIPRRHVESETVRTVTSCLSQSQDRIRKDNGCKKRSVSVLLDS